MPRVSIEVSDMVALANQIREITKSEDRMSVVDMTNELSNNAGSGGESGVPIEVSELPEATADTVGKVYLNTTDGNYYAGKQSTDFLVGEPLGDKIYFDTTKNPVDYIDMRNPLISAGNGTTIYHLSMGDILAVQGVTGYGHCYVLGVATSDMSSILGIAYVSCDVLNVEQFNQMVGSQFGLTITEFGWQTDVFDVSAIADYEVEINNLTVWDHLAYGEEEYYWNNQVDELIQDGTEIYTSFIKDGMREYAFAYSRSLRSVSFPNLVFIPLCAFDACENLQSVNIPNAKIINSWGFYYCHSLTSVNFPKATSIGIYAFERCDNLTSVNLPNVMSIGSCAFRRCFSLTKVIIATKQTTVAPLEDTGAFAECYHILGTVGANYNPNGLKDGYIYVPLSLVADYRVATNWATYATQIMPWVATVEELANIDGTTYDHACVGEGLDGVEYAYNGTTWEIFR